METIKKIFNDSINIVLASNDNYVIAVYMALFTLIENSSATNNYDIVILESDITDENKEMISSLAKDKDNISIRFYSTKKLFEETPLWHYNYWTIDTYARLWIGEIFEGYEKVVYIDCDVIILADIAELYNIDMTGYIMAGRRNHNILVNYKIDKELKYYLDNIYKVAPNEIVNAGVLVLNVPLLKEAKPVEKCIELLDKYKRLFMQDEEVLNQVAKGKIKYFESGWNFNNIISPDFIFDYEFLEYVKEYVQGFFEMKLIHYSTKIKPWDEPQLYYAELWWEWAKKCPIYKKILNDFFAKHPEKLQQ